MPQPAPGGWTQNRYSGLGQLLTDPVSVTGVPAVWGDAGTAPSIALLQALTMLNSRTTLFEATKICPPASVGVLKRWAPKAALWNTVAPVAQSNPVSPLPLVSTAQTTPPATMGAPY